MATVIIRPSSDNAILRASANDNATTNLYSYVDEESVSDLDYVKEVVGQEQNGYAVFNFGDVSLPAGSTIDKIILFARVSTAVGLEWSDIGGNVYGFKINTHSTNYSYEPPATAPNTFTDVTNELTVNPNTGNTWTETEINDLVYGFSCYTESSKNKTLQFSQLYITVYYTEAAGGGIAIPVLTNQYRQRGS